MALRNALPAFLAPVRLIAHPSPSAPSANVCSPHLALPCRAHRRNALCSLLSPETASHTIPSQNIRSEAMPQYPEWRHLGPPLAEGPLPTVIYFALTAEQSLELDPFNQFVTSLHPNPRLRILSVTLPLHTSDMPSNERVFHRWADVYRSGGDLVSSFVRNVSTTIDSMIDAHIIQRDAVFVAGLSRGGMLAAHVAAANTSVRACLGFAPLTVLSDLPEFAELAVPQQRAREKIRRASLLNPHVVDKLVHIPVRFYMGNFDKRVGTRNAFELTHSLAERAAHRGARSPPHEFIMYCSVGKHGHGTPPDVFQAGAAYIEAQIESATAQRARIKGQ